MASTATPKKAAEAAVKARDEATRAHEEAQAAYEAAKAHQVDVERRLTTTGDVTQDEHDSAIFETKRAAGAIVAAQEARTAAEHEAQVLTAIAVAGEVVDGKASRAELDEAIDAAKADVTKAVQSLAGKIRHRNRAIAEATEAGKAAGLQEGRVDPASPVIVSKRVHQHQPWRKANGYDLLLNGEVEAAADLTEVVASTLTAAARSAGIEVQVGGGSK